MTMDPSQPVQPVPSTPTEPVPAAVVAVRPRAKSGGLINVLLIVAAALAVGGVAFAVGRSTAPASAFPNAGGPGGFVPPGGSFAPGAGGPQGGFGGGLSIDGTVTAIDADSVTLTLENGNEQTIAIDDSTTYREATQATAADVAVGDAISIQVDGGGRFPTGGADPSSTPELTAGEITVSR